MRHFQIVDKIDSFLRNVSDILWRKKGRLDLWKTAEFTYNYWLAIFFLPLSILGENRAKLKKLFNLNSRQRSQNTQYPLIIFLSTSAVMQGIFWTEDNFHFISNCRNSFNCKLKKLINEQIIIFYSPSNVLCSSNESVQMSDFTHLTFLCMWSLFTWFNL